MVAVPALAAHSSAFYLDGRGSQKNIIIGATAYYSMGPAPTILRAIERRLEQNYGRGQQIIGVS
jgi:hypothetical protein